ncbi:MAG TPA: phosphate regulon sensor histidine kinase PhoR [Burkholderiales bacterium]|nr:phosphate regulon sensor histidine kinase PhoR [Burkholderiales bacterium]
MNFLWGRPLSTVFLIGVIVLLSWPLLGHGGALLFLCMMLLGLLMHHLRNLSLLYRWLQHPQSHSLPTGSGAWEYLSSHMLKMLKRQRETEARLNEALSRFQLAGAALPDAVVILDGADRIEWCNPSAENYFGLDNNRDRGQQITYILRQPQFVQHLASEHAGDPLVLRMSRPAGEMVLAVQQVPYGENHRLLLGRDITRWERLETTRRDFVANVSHELRTPLTVVGGFLETLADMEVPDPEMSRRAIGLMRQQTSRMTRLVEDLLTLSRLESAQSPSREEDVNVPEMVRALLHEAQALSAGHHQIRLVVESADWLKGNTEELRSAFSNLVSNAVRYTPDNGAIEISWKVRDTHLVFAVKDNGIGIEPQHIDRLTERFYRVDRSRSRETGGTGLGLAIVKHVVNRHQGLLDIQSTPGSGSTFSVLFPETRRLATGRPATPAKMLA